MPTTIPASILEPFGYTGVPILFDTNKVTAITEHLDDIFWAMTFSAEIYDLDKEAAKNRLAELCGGLKTIAKMMRAEDISILPVTLQKDGKLVGINIIVEFTANGKRHKHNLRDRNGV